MRRRDQTVENRVNSSRKVSVGRDGLATSFISPNDEFMSKWKRDSSQTKQLSLRDEARQTQSHSSSYFDRKLRFNKVDFVSAGTISGEDLTRTGQDLNSKAKKVAAAQSTESVAVPQQQMANLTVTDDRTQQTTAHDMLHSATDAIMVGTSSEGDGKTFFVDVQGSPKPTQVGFSMGSENRSSSPEGSISSDEEILFTGRENSRNAKRSHISNHPSFRSRPNPRVLSEPVGTNDDKGGRPIAKEDFAFLSDELPTAVTAPQARSSYKSKKHTIQNLAASKSGSSKTPRKGKSARAQRTTQKNAIFADYVANIDHDLNAEGTNDNGGFLFRQLDTLETSGWEDEPGGFEAKSPVDSNTSYSEAWDTADLQDFDELSTSNEILGNVQKIISKRERPSGLQYLVVFEGHAIDEARWLHSTALAEVDVLQKIRDFEIQQVELEHEWDDSGSEESAEEAQIAKDVQEEIDDLLDNQDLLDRQRERMTDERLARLLSKQEELGLGSEELLLFDDRETSNKRVNWNAVAGSRGNQKSERSYERKKAQRWPQGDFVNASLLADVLDQDPHRGFELMNMDRPGLRKKSKGRRGQMPLELSDSELEQSLQAAWENDRTKKKNRKIEREELRVQGLLGKKGKLDMKAKYSHGIAMSQVREEIKGFLSSTNETLSLPPMGKRERFLVHEIANTFGLKSKSIGNGASRFPTLIRTKHTKAYDESLLKPHLAKVLGVYIPRKDKAAKRAVAVRTVARGGGFSKSAVSYRDGDVVGASAPELGMENKGRNMLEKMGWSTGTALGAMNNKGIMQPVPHVVKVSKAGLG